MDKTNTAFVRRLDAKLVISVISCGIMACAGVIVETAMNVAFPVLMREFSVDTSTVQWVTTAYLLVLSCLVPISSVLNRRFKTKSLFIAAISLFLIGTIMCGIAPTFAFIIAGRVIEGIGTGLALPLMFNIILEQAPVPRLGFMMGLGTLVVATAPAVGPSLGGFIIETLGWRAIFAVLVPFLVVAFIGGVWAIRQAHSCEQVTFSFVQFGLLSAAFTCLIFAISQASTRGWDSPLVIVLLAGTLVCLGAFVVVSLRSRSPLIRLHIFGQKPFVLSVVYVICLQGIVLALGYLIPYFGQVVCGLSEFAAGCLLLPGCIIGAILAPIGGRILDRMGSARPLLFGAAVQLAACICFYLFGFSGAAWIIAAVYMLIPISQGFSGANAMTHGISSLPDALHGDGNAVFNTVQQLGGALGTAIATSIVNTAQAANSANLVMGTVQGTQNACLALLLASAVAALCMGVQFVRKVG